jgi:hypothetical protein
MKHVIDEFYKAKESPFGNTLKGVGKTMEWSVNNPVMFELLSGIALASEAFRQGSLIEGVYALPGTERAIPRCRTLGY